MHQGFKKTDVSGVQATAGQRGKKESEESEEPECSCVPLGSFVQSSLGIRCRTVSQRVAKPDFFNF